MVQVSVGTDILIDAVEDRFANVSPTYGVPQYTKVGTGAQSPSVGSTDLTTPVPVTYTEVDDCDATTGWSASTDGSVALNNTDGEFVEGTGCLNLVKSGGTQTSVTYSKTTTSADFTSKALWLWIYFTDVDDLKASGTCVEVRFGSDSSNYYYKQYAASALADGQNWLHFTSATATGTTGSPSITACDYTAVILTVDSATDTFTGNRVRIDHVQIAATTDFELAFDTGPEANASTDRVDSTSKLTLPMAAGQPLTNAGWFLSTDNMYGIDQITEDQKTQEEEWELSDSVQFQQIP